MAKATFDTPGTYDRAFTVSYNKRDTPTEVKQRILAQLPDWFPPEDIDVRYYHCRFDGRSIQVAQTDRQGMAILGSVAGRFIGGGGER